MKSITLFLILFVIKSSVLQTNQNKYTFNTFIDKLKKEGTFEIILSIKMQIGEDVAIITCQELNKGYEAYCKKIVQYYMPNFSAKSKMNSSGVHELSKDKKVDIQRILNKKFSKTRAKSINDNIIKKAQKSII